MTYICPKLVRVDANQSSTPPTPCSAASKYSVEKSSSAIKPTRNGDTIAPSAVVPAAHPICSPEKWSDCPSHVPSVTYQAPQMKYSRNIMNDSRNLIPSCIAVAPSVNSTRSLSVEARSLLYVTNPFCIHTFPHFLLLASCLLIGQCKRHIHSPGPRLRVLPSTSRDHDELPPIHLVGCRRGVPGKGQSRLPEQLARGLIKRPELLIKIRRPDKQQTSCRDNRPAIVFRSRMGHALRRQLRVNAQRDLPRILPRIQIDRVQRAPGRRNGRVPVWIQELQIASESVPHLGERSSGTRELLALDSH